MSIVWAHAPEWSVAHAIDSTGKRISPNHRVPHEVMFNASRLYSRDLIVAEVEKAVRSSVAYWIMT